MSFPNFSNIEGFVQSTLNNRKGNTELLSKLNPFVRITSGASSGLVMVSNPDFKLLQAAGTTYGSASQAGAIGTTLGGTAVNPNAGHGYRPSPIVTSLEIDEGSGTLSRKASISITAFTKEQMEVITKYYLEPGFVLFIEWGWGVGGYGGLQGLGASNVASFQSSVRRTEVRKNTGGNYDNYLGFITGGGVALDGDKWTISINCTGYTELPLYLLNTETGEQKTNLVDGVLNGAKPFGLNYIDTQNSSPADERFMKMFNDLPKTRRTKAVKALRGNASVNTLSSFINFDDEVSEDVNNETDGVSLPLPDWDIFKSKLKVDGKEVVFPKGTKIVGEEKFIRFDTLMRIIYEIGIEGYKLPDGKVITTKVDYEDTLCSSFENIFSTSASKLFIPNPKTPKFKLTDNPDINSLKKNTSDNSIEGVVFPNQTKTTFKPKEGLPIVKDPYLCGYLKNLYVNFDFAKGILETENFFLKDALFQILNGMSSAVNGMWDFQIEETEVGNTSILKIWEMNMISDGTKGGPYTFDMVGENSIFIEASLDLNISGMKMNQIVGQKSSYNLNSPATKLSPTLFRSGFTDSYGLTIQPRNISTDDPDTSSPEDKKSIAEENLNILLGKAKFYPKVEFTDSSTFGGELYNMCYLGAFEDSSIFSAFKSGHDLKDEANTASPLMPITFTFKVHGISGIRRGDMFKVRGLPSMYDDGFFQVLSIKHSLQGMEWTTEVTGGFRSNN